MLVRGFTIPSGQFGSRALCALLRIYDSSVHLSQRIGASSNAVLVDEPEIPWAYS